jgi:hypothetical protein
MGALPPYLPEETVSRRALASAVLLAAVLVAPSTPSAQAAPVRAVETTVDVDVRAGLATVPATAYGVNHAIWDAQLGTPAVSDLLRDAGVSMVRYPGGSYGDIYHWQTHTAPGGYVAPDTDFDTFMAGARRTGAEPMIIANYGTGTAQEAADWVRYANITKGYHATYWTIGNENYGNGHYGTAWEADDHADKSPAQYAAEVVAYSKAMKAVDPSIRIGAVLTMPGNWPDGITAEGDAGTWNREVLTRAGSAIDFADVHWYPGGATAAESLTKPAQIQDALFLLKDQIRAYAAKELKISLTEVNAGVGQNTQPGALFLADVYSGLLAEGVFTVQWWNVHNGIGTVSTVAGQTDYGDYGLLSSGTCTSDNSVCEPPLNTPFAPYFGLRLTSGFARPGDRLVAAGSNDSLVSAHAARRPDGSLAVQLLNKDPDQAHTVTLNYHGFTPSPAVPAVDTYLNGGTSIQSARSGSATRQTLPAYAMSTVILQPAAAEPPAVKQPGKPAAGAVSDRTATISWPGSGAGLKYEIYRQTGGAAGQLAETTATTYTLSNLDPGRRYTINVVARDSAGRQSPPSDPLTFTTGTPSAAPCAVKLSNSNDWGNGFVAGLDITNTTDTPVAGWTLTFAWPTMWQSVSSGWNATFTQDGRTVRVTADTPIAPGATHTAGFVASYGGPNVWPATFTLNGTLCTTLP